MPIPYNRNPYIDVGYIEDFMKNEYIKYKNGEDIDHDFEGNGLNTDLDAFKELAELGLKNIEETLKDKRVSNNDREIQLRAKFLNKIIMLIDKEQAAKIPSPPRMSRTRRPSRRRRSVSPMQNTLGDGRVRSSGGKRTRKHKRSIRKRKHKKA
jgi:hypothetical protein